MTYIVDSPCLKQTFTLKHRRDGITTPDTFLVTTSSLLRSDRKTACGVAIGSRQRDRVHKDLLHQHREVAQGAIIHNAHTTIVVVLPRVLAMMFAAASAEPTNAAHWSGVTWAAYNK